MKLSGKYRWRSIVLIGGLLFILSIGPNCEPKETEDFVLSLIDSIKIGAGYTGPLSTPDVPYYHPVSILRHKFNPQMLEITLIPGKKEFVVWDNKDTLPHRITSDAGTFNEYIPRNGCFTWQVNSIRIYNYHCFLYSYKLSAR